MPETWKGKGKWPVWPGITDKQRADLQTMAGKAESQEAFLAALKKYDPKAMQPKKKKKKDSLSREAVASLLADDLRERAEWLEERGCPLQAFEEDFVNKALPLIKKGGATKEALEEALKNIKTDFLARVEREDYGVPPPVPLRTPKPFAPRVAPIITVTAGADDVSPTPQPPVAQEGGLLSVPPPTWQQRTGRTQPLPPLPSLPPRTSSTGAGEITRRQEEDDAPTRPMTPFTEDELALITSGVVTPEELVASREVAAAFAMLEEDEVTLVVDTGFKPTDGWVNIAQNPPGGVGPHQKGG